MLLGCVPSWISVLVCRIPSCLIPNRGGLMLLLGKATLQVLLLYLSFLFGYSKDFEEINRDRFTPFIL